MFRKKLFQTCMAGVISASMIVSAVPAAAAEFAASEAAAETAVSAEEMQETEGAEEFEAEEAQDAQAEAEEFEAETQNEETEEVQEEVQPEVEPALFAENEEAVEEAESFSDTEERAASSVALSTKYFDATFMKYLQEYDTNKDNKLSSTEIASIKKLNVSGKKLKSLKGVEYLTSLTELNCSNNSLTSLNVTKNTKLTLLNTSKNSLKSLDLTKNTALTYLICANNQLTSLKMPSKMSKLNFVNCSSNKLTTLPFNINNSYMPKLEEVNCSNNSITSLNLKGYTGIMDASNNKLTTLTDGCDGYQCIALYIKGKYNTLSKTKTVDFTTLGNVRPMRFECESSVKSKIKMITGKLSASVKDFKTIDVTFTSTADDAAYVLERKIGSSGSWEKVAVYGEGSLGSAEFDENSYTEENITVGQTYYYRLTVSVNVQDKSQKDNVWKSTVSKTVKVVPATPSLKGTGGTGSIKFTWGKLSGVDGYELYYSNDGKTFKKLKSFSGSTTSYTKTKLSRNRYYYYKMRAYKKDAKGSAKYGSFTSAIKVKTK